ncbi:MAG: hypothetical protein ACOYOK_02165 [Pseudobdellovibrionaceae bacterium]
MLYLKEMHKMRLLQTSIILSILLSNRADASFYSAKDKLNYTQEQLLSDFDLVVLTSKDCSACKQLQIILEKCELPHDFKTAWVESQATGYKFQIGSIRKIKTSEKTIQKITSLTPKSFLNGKPFKEGLFKCNELKTEMLNDPPARLGNL